MKFKKLLFTVFFISCFGFITIPNVILTKWVICKNSSLIVKGNTNFSSFTCTIPSYPKSDTIFISQFKDAKSIPLSGEMQLDIKSFDCNNRMMTSELRKTLKEKEFPFITIKFISLSEFPDLNKKSYAKGVVEIEIAGAKKRYEVNYQIVADANHNMILTTEKDVNFSDFNLIPPMKIGRLVKAKDKLSVGLTLSLKVVN